MATYFKCNNVDDSVVKRWKKDGKKEIATTILMKAFLCFIIFEILTVDFVIHLLT